MDKLTSENKSTQHLKWE